MEHLILITVCAALFVVLKYRVRIVVSYESRGESRKGRRSCGKETKGLASVRREKPGSSLPGEGDGGPVNVLEDLTSALMNLGCDRVKAKRIASKSSMQGGGFDQMLRRAIQEAA
jgi:hypothetical protein